MVVLPYFTPSKKVVPFSKLLELSRIDDRTFRSIVQAYSPTGAENGTYGGHVFAQAAWAAAQTVAEGFVIHVCNHKKLPCYVYLQAQTMVQLDREVG